MTLTTAQLGPLSRLLAASRTDWDVQGVMAFVEQLARDPRPWPELQVQAIRQAANAKNLTPKCILDPLPVEATVRTITPTPPRHDDPECPTHGGTIHDDQGVYACCKFDHDPTPPAYLRCGVSDGPSDAARELIETRLGPRRRAREMAGSVEQEAEQG